MGCWNSTTLKGAMADWLLFGIIPFFGFRRESWEWIEYSIDWRSKKDGVCLVWRCVDAAFEDWIAPMLVIKLVFGLSTGCR